MSPLTLTPDEPWQAQASDRLCTVLGQSKLQQVTTFRCHLEVWILFFFFFFSVSFSLNLKSCINLNCVSLYVLSLSPPLSLSLSLNLPSKAQLLLTWNRRIQV